MDSLILGSDGKPLQLVTAKDTPCPKCGSGPTDRFPSGGFGQTWFVCKCGYEFKELPCPSVLL